PLPPKRRRLMTPAPTLMRLLFRRTPKRRDAPRPMAPEHPDPIEPRSSRSIAPTASTPPTGPAPAHPTPEQRVRRRDVLSMGAALTGGSLLLGSRASLAQAPRRPQRDWLTPGLPGRHYTPVIVPNGSKLPYRIVDGVKVFHLVAEEVE